MTGGAPRPLLFDGVVTIDSRARALVVRPAADASATAKLLWRDAVRGQATAVRLPAATAARLLPPVWATGAGKWRAAHGLPRDENALEFRFATGDPVYQELVGSYGLTARIGVDRASGRIINVTFKAGSAA